MFCWQSNGIRALQWVFVFVIHVEYQVEIFRPSGIPDPGNPYCLGAIPTGNVPAWYVRCVFKIYVQHQQCWDYVDGGKAAADIFQNKVKMFFTCERSLSFPRRGSHEQSLACEVQECKIKKWSKLLLASQFHRVSLHVPHCNWCSTHRLLIHFSWRELPAVHYRPWRWSEHGCGTDEWHSKVFRPMTVNVDEAEVPTGIKHTKRTLPASMNGINDSLFCVSWDVSP